MAQHEIVGELDKGDAKKGKKSDAVNYYCDSNDSSIWWNTIKVDFKAIFGPIVRGLRALHGKEKSHGNLLNGVAVKAIKRKQYHTLTDILFNMTSDSRKY